MSLSRKNYEAVARILKTEVDALAARTRISDDSVWEVETVLAALSHDLANYFETDNARFDRAKFLAACGAR